MPSASYISVKGLKVGIPKEYYNEHMSEEVLDAWDEAAKILADGGAIVKEVSVRILEIMQLHLFPPIDVDAAYGTQYCVLHRYKSVRGSK